MTQDNEKSIGRYLCNGKSRYEANYGGSISRIEINNFGRGIRILNLVGPLVQEETLHGYLLASWYFFF